MVMAATTTTCSAEHHARLRREPRLLVQLTSPGARTAGEEPGSWVELRHCLACGATLSLAGHGVSSRWLYAVHRGEGAALSFATTLEEARGLLLEAALPPAAVDRYVLGSYHHQPLTEAERFWLDDAYSAGGGR